MLPALRIFLDIALLRRGPEDVPVSQSLLLATIGGFLALSFGLRLLFEPSLPQWPLQILISILFALLWYRVLLGVFGKSERFQQTMTAIFGVNCLLTPFLVPIETLVRPFVEKPNDASPWVVLLLPLAVYVIYVTARILRSAIDRPMFQCVALVLLHTLLEPFVMGAFLDIPVTPAAGG